MKHKLTSIVIPAYNEANRLPKSIEKLKKYLSSEKINAEILIIVEKSSDQTLQLVKKAINKDKRFLVIDSKVHKGKGYAVKTGVRKSSGEYVFFMDADLSTDLKSLKKFLDKFDSNPKLDILIGNRAHPDSKISIPQGGLRKNLGKINNYLLKLLRLSSFSDTQCGFKGFKKEAAKEIFRLLKTDGFAFDVEVLYLAGKLGYKVEDMPVVWRNSSESKVGFKSTFKMLVDITKIRLRG